MTIRTNAPRQAQMKVVYSCRFCGQVFAAPKRNTEGFCDAECRGLWEDNGNRSLQATGRTLRRCTQCGVLTYSQTCKTCQGRVRGVLQASKHSCAPRKRKTDGKQWNQATMELFTDE